ncbi:hypothetical protein O152_gp160 [Pseudomonas phage PaBG]|uniref:Uncharacterized protein n=1 Tax=Pseudomonas phage PaBG TaxID=1335230 RepID=S5VV83_9CAUD|nr:hypothetical protein O152_gp160 [Pseudomonas phage PaBG]AGS82042.1 hypothetical protein PaBG_00160 [Pseudomonas phage PaBG]
MGIYLRVTDQALIDAVSNMRGNTTLVQDKTLLELCKAASHVHYENGEPVGLLVDHTMRKSELTAHSLEGLVLRRDDVPCFGRLCSLYVPNRRTIIGKEIASIMDAISQSSRVARYAVDLVAPRIKSKIAIDDFQFDYRAQARVHFIAGNLYIGMAGVSIVKHVYDVGHGVELIERAEYRAAVKQHQVSAHNHLFNENDSLVHRAKAALDPFLPLDLAVVSSLLTDIYQRVIVKPKDIAHYIPHVLLERELMYVYASLVAILHAFYGVE